MTKGREKSIVEERREGRKDVRVQEGRDSDEGKRGSNSGRRKQRKEWVEGGKGL